MVTQIKMLATVVVMATLPPPYGAQRRGRRGEAGLEVLQVVILAAAFAALAILAAAIIKIKVIDTANSIQTQ